MTAPTTTLASDGTFTIRRDSLRAKLLFAISADRSDPTPLQDLIRAAYPSTDKHVSVELHHLVTIGAIERVGRGLYVRLVGDVREFRG